MQIAYKDRITRETIRQEDTTGTNVQQDRTDAIKWLGQVLRDEGLQTDKKCTPVVSVGG